MSSGSGVPIICVEMLPRESLVTQGLWNPNLNLCSIQKLTAGTQQWRWMEDDFPLVFGLGIYIFLTVGIGQHPNVYDVYGLNGGTECGFMG